MKLNSLTILPLITGLLLLNSCEDAAKAQFQQGYYDATAGSTPEVQRSMDRMTADGTDFPTGEAMTREFNTIGECEACQAAAASNTDPTGSVITGETCRHFNSFKNAGINEKALKQALFYYDKNKRRFSNQRYVSIADYSKNSAQKRFYILDMQTGSVQTEHVSHGSGASKYGNPGDPNHDGMLDRCHRGNSSNADSRYAMTRGGFFQTGEFYHSSSNANGWPVIAGSNYNGLRMTGLTSGVNDEAMSKGVVMHGANYNTGTTMGRSFGCPAFRPNRARDIMGTINGGSLYYSYVPQCSLEQGIVDQSVSGWQNMCG